MNELLTKKKENAYMNNKVVRSVIESKVKMFKEWLKTKENERTTNQEEREMSNNKSTSGISIGFFGALTLTFIILKLCNVIDWSWWWVLSPTWISAAIIITFVFIIAYYEAKIEIKKKEIEAQQRREGKQSKFMQRLQEAMDESEKKRQTKLN